MGAGQDYLPVSLMNSLAGSVPTFLNLPCLMPDDFTVLVSGRVLPVNVSLFASYFPRFA